MSTKRKRAEAPSTPVPISLQAPPHSHSLRQHLLQPRTNRQYTTAVHIFLQYCIDEGYDIVTSNYSVSSSTSFSSSSSSPVYDHPDREIDLLDCALSDYINESYLHGTGKYYQMSNTVHGIHLYSPKCKGKLCRSYQLLTSWKKFQLKHKVYRTPLTEALVYVLVTSMLKGGYTEAAVATLLAFDCYLRVGELCSLRICDIQVPMVTSISSLQLQQQQLPDTGMILALTHTKTGPNQHVTVRIPLLCHMVLQLIKDRPLSSRSLLFSSLSPSVYRRLFTLTCDVVGLSSYGFAPHSLRHGGATHDYRVNPVNINMIIRRGRWALAKSADTYIQSGIALAVQIKQPALEQMGQCIKQQANDLYQLFLQQRN